MAREEELKYSTEEHVHRLQWVPDMLHTYGYGEAVIQQQVEQAAALVLNEMARRGLLLPETVAADVARGLGLAAARKVAFLWHDKKPLSERESV